ncbi:MAG TPA: nucleotidyltransferase family protein [Sedimentisphaerales bacterium]|nr:nucleotidyltransferase family protein [Sedimentisphaerales bacterium]
MRPMDLGVSPERFVGFCRRWKISRLAVFGSALRGELRPDSDIDLLAIFAEDAEWSMFDHYRMEDELVELLGREVDLISKEAVEENPNPIFRREILTSAREIYAA